MGAKNLTPQNIMGQKFNPHKIPCRISEPKNFQRNHAAAIRGNYHESSDCFEYPKKSLLKSSYQKNSCQNFPTQKIPKLKISTTPKILRSSLSLEIRSTPWDMVLGSSSLHVNSPFVNTFRASYQVLCTFERSYIKRLTGFKLCATTSNNIQE